MKIIAGLGNPGAEYAKTKHNVGFMLMDALAAHLNAASWREDFHSLVLEVRIGGEKVFLVKPLTYMNNSGEALGPMLSYYKLDTEDLVVAHDDMDIPAGTVRIRKKGGSGGHNGIKSIIAHVGSENFARVRIACRVERHQSRACAVFGRRCAADSRGDRLFAARDGVHRARRYRSRDESLQSA